VKNTSGAAERGQMRCHQQVVQQTHTETMDARRGNVNRLGMSGPLSLNNLGLRLSFWHTLSFDYEYWNQRVE
jgi:hypothetical protein